MEKVSVIILIIFILGIAIYFLRKYKNDIIEIVPDFLKKLFRKNPDAKDYTVRRDTKNKPSEDTNPGDTENIPNIIIDHIAPDETLIKSYPVFINIGEKICIQRKSAKTSNYKDIAVDAETINANTFYLYCDYDNDDKEVVYFIAYRRYNKNDPGIQCDENGVFFDSHNLRNNVPKIISPIIVFEPNSDHNEIVPINGTRCFDGLRFCICDELFVFRFAKRKTIDLTKHFPNREKTTKMHTTGSNNTQSKKNTKKLPFADE